MNRKLPALVADGSTQHPDIHAIGKVSTSVNVMSCSAVTTVLARTAAIGSGYTAIGSGAIITDAGFSMLKGL